EEVFDHFVPPRLRLDEVRMFLVIFQQPVGVFAHAEIVALFLQPFHRPSAVRAVAVHELALEEERFARGAVPAFILAEIHVPLFHELGENALHRLLVAFLRRADEVVVADLQLFPQRLDALHDAVHVFLGGDAVLLGLPLDFLPVLVRSRQEHHVVAAQPLVAGHGVRRHRAVGVADVQPVARVIDRRRDVEGFAFFRHGRLPPPIRSCGHPPSGRKADDAGIWKHKSKKSLHPMGRKLSLTWYHPFPRPVRTPHSRAGIGLRRRAGSLRHFWLPDNGGPSVAPLPAPAGRARERMLPDHLPRRSRYRFPAPPALCHRSDRVLIRSWRSRAIRLSSHYFHYSEAPFALSRRAPAAFPA